MAALRVRVKALNCSVECLEASLESLTRAVSAPSEVDRAS